MMCEDDEEHRFALDDLRFTDFDRLQIDLLSQAGYVEMHSPRFKPETVPAHQRLEYGTYYFTVTWTGQDYLQAIRDQDVWDKVKRAVAESGGSATMELVKALGLGFLKNRFPAEQELIYERAMGGNPPSTNRVGTNRPLLSARRP